jgi:hypothetical protein
MDEGTAAKVTVTAYTNGDPVPMSFDLSELGEGEPMHELEPAPSAPPQ